jgi:hypothetical protein
MLTKIGFVSKNPTVISVQQTLRRVVSAIAGAH